MGYMGLNSVRNSDSASDLAYDAIGSMVKGLRKGLKEEGNEYNTNGPVNVALFFEAYIIPLAEEYQDYSDVWDLARDTKTELQAFRNKMKENDWGKDVTNKKMHIDAYNRMLKALNRFLEKN